MWSEEMLIADAFRKISSSDDFGAKVGFPSQVMEAFLVWENYFESN
jgi:hypothetical protein